MILLASGRFSQSAFGSFVPHVRVDILQQSARSSSSFRLKHADESLLFGHKSAWVPSQFLLKTTDDLLGLRERQSERVAECLISPAESKGVTHRLSRHRGWSRSRGWRRSVCRRGCLVLGTRRPRLFVTHTSLSGLRRLCETESGTGCSLTESESQMWCCPERQQPLALF